MNVTLCLYLKYGQTLRFAHIQYMVKLAKSFITMPDNPNQAKQPKSCQSMPVDAIINGTIKNN